MGQGEDVREGSIAERAAAGDASAFAALFDIHAQAVYRFCWRRAPEASQGVDAEDLMSIVFLEAWARRADLRVVDGSARAWLFAIANNVLRNRRRAVRRYGAALARVPREQDQLDPAADVIDRIDAQDSVRAVLADLSRLGRREREIIELCGIEGVPLADAARILGVPLGTVKSRLARARARLAAMGHTGDFGDPGRANGQEQGERAERASTLGRIGWSH